MSVMIEVEYGVPVDQNREDRIVAVAAKYGGKLTDRDEPAMDSIWQWVCLTIEFDEWPAAEAAANELWQSGERIDGPMEYGDD